jgi:ribA/ribD-fused uncharacterized protein
MRTDPVSRPITPATSYGHHSQERGALAHNPLPEPPKDVFTMTPYKTLMNLPHTSALLTANMSRDIIPGKKKKKGFLRGLVRSHEKDAETAIRFVPIPESQQAGDMGVPPVMMATEPARESAGLASQAARATTPAPSIAQLQAQVGVTPGATLSRGMSTTPAPGMPQVAPVEPLPAAAPMPTSGRAIRFDQHSAYACFLNHSPHPVEWQGIVYPTGAHLFEALRYLPNNPEIAQQIARLSTVEEALGESARWQNAGYEKPDWPSLYMTHLTEVLIAKFRQHPDLMHMLVSTQNDYLIYHDENDDFWGDGIDGLGRNELGQALIRVRDQFQREGHT